MILLVVCVEILSMIVINKIFSSYYKIPRPEDKISRSQRKYYNQAKNNIFTRKILFLHKKYYNHAKNNIFTRKIIILRKKY